MNFNDEFDSWVLLFGCDSVFAMKFSVKRLLTAILAAFAAFGLIGCGSLEDTSDLTEESSGAYISEETSAFGEAVTIQVFAMDSYMELTAYGENAQEALDKIAEEIETLDSLLSVTDEDSEIYALNNAGGEAVEVSGTVISLISFAKEIGAQSGGALDITIYPVLKAWGFTTGSYQVPSDSEIEELLSFVDQSLIEIDEEAGTVTLPEGMQIDLGSVVKGYVCSVAGDILEEFGVECALLNFAGSTIGLVGTKTDKSSWNVAIQDPEDDYSYAGILSAENVTIDTSGGYERYFTDDDGNVWWHIIDPETGKPADSGLISVSIISEDSLLGDALSTACFVMGLDDTVEYWQTYGGFEFILITEDHEIYISEGIADDFTPVYDYADAQLTVVYYE